MMEPQRGPKAFDVKCILRYDLIKCLHWQNIYAIFCISVYLSRHVTPFYVKVSTLVIPVSPLHPEVGAVSGVSEVLAGCLRRVDLHVWIKSHSATEANKRPVLSSREQCWPIRGQ